MNSWWFRIGVGVLALAAVSCGGSESSGDPEEVELRSYTVPEGFNRNEWQGLLSESLRTGETRIGAVTRGPANTLVITAPRSVHEGVGGQSSVAAGRLGQMRVLDPVLTQITSADGNWSEVRGRQVKVSQRFSEQGAGVRIAEINISMQGSRGQVHNLDSRIKLEPGKFIVLGQTSYDARNGFVPAGLDPDDDLMLYYVITAQSD